jgi:hypothetical protein
VVTAYKSAVGVSDAVANFKDKTVTVAYDSAKTNPETLVKVLAGSPYSASKHDSPQ